MADKEDSVVPRLECALITLARDTVVRIAQEG